MNLDRIEEMLTTEWPHERNGRQHLPESLAYRRPLNSSVRFRPRSRAGFGAAAATAAILVIVGGTLLTGGAWLHRQEPSASPSASATTAQSPTPSLTPVPSSTPPPSPSFTAGSFRATGSALASAPWGRNAVLLQDGRVLVLSLGDAELYDPSKGTFSATGPELTPRLAPSVTLLGDGEVLVAGGGNHDNKLMYNTAELYDPLTGKFTMTGSMKAAHEGQSGTLLADGDVLIAGGDTGTGAIASTAELYHPRTGQFATTGSMPIPMTYYAATLLNDGRVLLTGAYSAPLLYDPQTGKITSAGSMTTARSQCATALLADGRVLFAGGDPPTAPGSLWTALASAEIFDPRTDQFTPTGSMAHARIFATATLLEDGRVLAVGGLDPQETNADGLPRDFASAEIYDPRTGTFTATGSMTVGRASQAAVLLRDGQVLIIGGDNNGGAAGSTAELYTP